MKIYSDNIKKFEDEILKLSRRLKHLSMLRLVVFILLLFLQITLLSLNLIIFFFIALPISIVVFGYILNHHAKIAQLKTHHEQLKTINELEILRAQRELEVFDPGLDFIDQNHPYTSDLDIFGDHSIFQLLNRTTTESGRSLLAAWLNKPAPKDQLPERQQAVKELAKKLDWRQHFEAFGRPFQNKKSDYTSLLHWVESPVVLLENKIFYRALTLFMPALFLISTYFFYASLDSINAFFYLAAMILIQIINHFIIKKLRLLAEPIVETSTRNLKTLQGYQALIKSIEKGSFSCKKLCDLQAKIAPGNASASKEMKRLIKTLEYSQQKPVKGQPLNGSAFYSLLNIILLLDIHLIFDTEKWKVKNRKHLRSWAEVISEFEVLTSFAGFAYANPTYTFPKIIEKQNNAYFKSLGHPLLPSESRVCNDFLSKGPGNVIMITGSNMAGKSTFLRSVGVNIVLALTGAPCCTTHGELSYLQLFTSMRTQDNLSKGISSFYAELSRIEQILERIKRTPNVFFLLDEMFKGTNSEDRHRGGFSLIKQISNLQASGIIATHDIELAKLAGDQNLVTNYSFNSEIKDKVMSFSYELHDGICHDFNASALMAKSGINIIKDIPKNGVK